MGTEQPRSGEGTSRVLVVGNGCQPALSIQVHAIINHMIVTFALFLLAFAAPQATTFTGEWLLTWDQMGPQYIRVSVTQEGAAVRVTWENESIQCTQTDNVCLGTVTENGNPEAGKAKITMNGDEIKGKAPTSEVP
jgi:hypothetical protein